MSDDQSGDQTEAELERTRRVVAAAMAEQIAVNDAAASVTSDADVEGDESPGEEDLSKLYKSELVDRAEAAGIETDGLSKAELIEALEAQEGVS
jgi:hypothetical protein